MPIRSGNRGVSRTVIYQCSEQTADRLSSPTPFAEVESTSFPKFLRGNVHWHAAPPDEQEVAAVGAASAPAGNSGAHYPENLIPFPGRQRHGASAAATLGACSTQSAAALTHPFPVHRVRGLLPDPQGDRAALRRDVQAQLLEWLSGLWAESLPEALGGLLAAGGAVEKDGHHLHVLAQGDEAPWALRMLVADPYLPERLWQADFTLTPEEKGDWLTFDLFVEDTAAGLPPPETMLPEVARRLMLHPGLYDAGQKVGEQPIPLRNESELEQLHVLLTAPTRRLPVLVITAAADRDQATPRYLINPGLLARTCAALAHTVALPPGLESRWQALVGADQSVAQGALRLYSPLTPQGELDSVFHSADFIRDWTPSESGGPASYPLFMRWTLLDGWPAGGAAPIDFEQLALRQRVGLSGIDQLPVAVVDRLIAYQLQVERMAAQQAELETRFQAAQEQVQQGARERDAITAERDDAKARLAEAQQQIETLEGRLAAHETSAGGLARDLAEKEAALTRQEQRGESLQARLDASQDEVKQLNARVQELTQQLAWWHPQETAETEPAAAEAIPMPDTLEDLQIWTEVHLDGKVKLHPRALRAAKNGVYQNVPLIYQSLLLLGNEYRNMRLREGEGNLKDILETRLHELGLTFGRSINPDIDGMHVNEYTVPYPSKKHGPNRLLEWHLRKGTSRDPRFTLCIYFFWCEETQQVVVGSLPAPLVNQLD